MLLLRQLVSVAASLGEMAEVPHAPRRRVRGVQRAAVSIYLHLRPTVVAVQTVLVPQTPAPSVAVDRGPAPPQGEGLARPTIEVTDGAVRAPRLGGVSRLVEILRGPGVREIPVITIAAEEDLTSRDDVRVPTSPLRRWARPLAAVVVRPLQEGLNGLSTETSVRERIIIPHAEIAGATTDTAFISHAVLLRLVVMRPRSRSGLKVGAASMGADEETRPPSHLRDGLVIVREATLLEMDAMARPPLLRLSALPPWTEGRPEVGAAVLLADGFPSATSDDRAGTVAVLMAPRLILHVDEDETASGYQMDLRAELRIGLVEVPVTADLIAATAGAVPPAEAA